MNSASRKRALRRAATYIESGSKEQEATVSEIAFSLLLHANDSNQRQLCIRLAGILCSDHDGQWIKDGTLHDVTLSLLAICAFDQTLMNGAYAAELAKTLLAHELAVGGPYAQRDTKPEVQTNAAIAQLFQVLGIPLLATVTFLKEAIAERPFSISLDTVLLVWPRTLPGIEDEEIAALLNGVSGVSTLDRIVVELVQMMAGLSKGDASLADKLIETQREDGSWHIRGLSEWFSTILAQKILSLYNTARSKKANRTTEDTSVPQGIGERLSRLSEPVRTTALSMQDAVAAVDTRHEITQFARSFADSLNTPSSQIPHEMGTALGMANFYFWMAYTIYDDFIDDEGRAEQLPVANIIQRDSLTLYEAALGSELLVGKKVSDYFDGVDEANAWELASCRMKIDRSYIAFESVPEYGDKSMLAHRAAGHIIGPLIIAQRQAGGRNKAVDQVYKGLSHYLIARQLNDDLHDWTDDLKRGHVSYVVAYLLASLHLNPGSYKIDDLCTRARNYLWNDGLTILCGEIQHHISQSRVLLQRSELLRDTGSFYQYLDFVESSVETSRRTYADHYEFLQKYSA